MKYAKKNGVQMDSATCSPEQTRTADMMVNSHPLYQLSYRGKLILDEE